MKEHLERYHEVLATLQEPVDGQTLRQDVLKGVELEGLEPIAL
jgi:hypothetical protein